MGIEQIANYKTQKVAVDEAKKQLEQIFYGKSLEYNNGHNTIYQKVKVRQIKKRGNANKKSNIE